MMDDTIRRIQAKLPAIIVSGLSLYFALAFCLSGAKTLLLLDQGTTDYLAAALAQALGYAFGPSFAKVTTAAAAIGASKLVVGGFFIVSLTERCAATVDGSAQKDYAALDLALQSAFVLTLFQVIPASIDGDPAGISMLMANFMLLCVAVGTSMFEREAAEHPATRVSHLKATSCYRPEPDQPLPTGLAPMR